MQEPATTAMALHGSGRRRHGHRAQQLAALAQCTAARRCRSARRHGRARGRGKRGGSCRPTRTPRRPSLESRSPPGVHVVPPEIWEPLGSASSRTLPTPGLELAHRPRRCGRRGPAVRARREQGMAVQTRGARELGRGPCSSDTPPSGREKAWAGRGRRRRGWGPTPPPPQGPLSGAPAPPRPPVLSRRGHLCWAWEMSAGSGELSHGAGRPELEPSTVVARSSGRPCSAASAPRRTVWLLRLRAGCPRPGRPQRRAGRSSRRWPAAAARGSGRRVGA
ncbi:hypothetical protein PVAP13_2NG591720 [Panicum virgatum]|uniref:Uncharacterized protein n=1 Tax=Panicum virgatum TaxID=38727 RepID=A0A8T0VU64_PANVG|nr:hypothetical protein PVAP13_2NG591720 [Panicum virgatum]